jgi:hypothetical protein
MTLAAAAPKAGLSKSYLSYIEIGSRPLSTPLRDKLMGIYGYSPASFRNFATDDKRAKSVPVHYKLDMLLRRMSPLLIERVYIFATQTAGADCSPCEQA